MLNFIILRLVTGGGKVVGAKRSYACINYIILWMQECLHQRPDFCTRAIYYAPKSKSTLNCIIFSSVIDTCCGSGGMFVQSTEFIEAYRGNRDSISVYGQESNADTWKMAKMNMAIRGIDANFGPYQADTFFNDLHPTLKADFIMANPPFNLSN